jgi:hypothetical protein
MIMKITMSLAALALGGTLTVGTALAQHTGARSPNDNGIPSTSSQSRQPAQSSAPDQQRRSLQRMYNEAPGMGGPDQSASTSCEARFQSYDPASGTYLGFDGMRHPCP